MGMDYAPEKIQTIERVVIQKEDPIIPVSTDTPVAVDISSILPSGWSEYVNDEYGFSIAFPKGYYETKEFWFDPEKDIARYLLKGTEEKHPSILLVRKPIEPSITGSNAEELLKNIKTVHNCNEGIFPINGIGIACMPIKIGNLDTVLISGIRGVGIASDDWLELYFVTPKGVLMIDGMDDRETLTYFYTLKKYSKQG